MPQGTWYLCYTCDQDVPFAGVTTVAQSFEIKAPNEESAMEVAQTQWVKVSSSTAREPYLVYKRSLKRS